MFVGHYGPSFAIKAIRPAIPLWLLFIAVQLVDVAFGIVMLAIQGYVFFGPPPTSPSAAAVTALISYVVFAAGAQWLDQHRHHATMSQGTPA